MPFDPILIGDEQKWGLLVKTWATGQDRINNGFQYPRPETIGQFNDQTKKAGANVTLPGHFTSLTIIQGPPELLLLKLPPREMVLDSENTLQTQPYSVPPFYSTVFENKPPVVVDKLKFHAERIGDYTIRFCM